MTRGEFLKKWSAVVYEPEPICANRFAMEPDLNAILVEEAEALMKQRDTAYERLEVALLQVRELKAALASIIGEAANADEMVGVAERALEGKVSEAKLDRPEHLCAARLARFHCELANHHEGLHCKFGQIADTTIWWKVGDANAMLAAAKSYPDHPPVSEKQVGWCPWCPGCGGLVHPGECGVH